MEILADILLIVGLSSLAFAVGLAADTFDRIMASRKTVGGITFARYGTMSFSWCQRRTIG